MHLAHVPRHIGGRKCNLQSGSDTLLVHLVHVVHPDRHPHTLVALFIPVVLKCSGVPAAPAASLRSLTKKDACFFPRSNRAKRGRRSPIPQFLPSPLLKPRERARDVGHIQYRSQAFGFHNERGYTPGPRRLDQCRSAAISIVAGIAGFASSEATGGMGENRSRTSGIRVEAAPSKQPETKNDQTDDPESGSHPQEKNSSPLPLRVGLLLVVITPTIRAITYILS